MVSEIDHLGLPKHPKDITPGLGIVIAKLRRTNPGWGEEQLRAEAKNIWKQRREIKAEHRKGN